MDYLKSILEEKDIENIYETFTDDVVLGLDKRNIQKIIIYLQENGVDYIYDILTLYPDLLTFDIEDFITKFEQIKRRYGINFNEFIGYDLSILEQMYT